MDQFYVKMEEFVYFYQIIILSVYVPPNIPEDTAKVR